MHLSVSARRVVGLPIAEAKDNGANTVHGYSFGDEVFLDQTVEHPALSVLRVVAANPARGRKIGFAAQRDNVRRNLINKTLLVIEHLTNSPATRIESVPQR